MKSVSAFSENVNLPYTPGTFVIPYWICVWYLFIMWLMLLHHVIMWSIFLVWLSMHCIWFSYSCGLLCMDSTMVMVWGCVSCCIMLHLVLL